jgi:CBS domain-containing protein
MKLVNIINIAGGIMSLKDLMSTELHFVNEKISILEAAKLMSRLNVGSLIVGKKERITGIFSEKDILDKVIVLGLSPETTCARDIMTHNVVTVDDSKSEQYALALMIARDIRHLPVIDESGICVGMVSLKDLVKPIVRRFERRDDTRYLTDDYERY